MKKKVEIPTNNPTDHPQTSEKGSGQRGDTRTRGDIKKIETDRQNPNNGAQQKSQKKS